jgi:hypothetical protein
MTIQKTKSAHGAAGLVKECMTVLRVANATAPALSLLRKMRMIAMTSTNWPFPPATGAIPWTAKQEQAYQQAQRNKYEDAPL